MPIVKLAIDVNSCSLRLINLYIGRNLMKNLLYKITLALLILLPVISSAQISITDNCLVDLNGDCVDIVITDPGTVDPGTDEFWIGFYETTNQIGNLIFHSVSAGSERLCATLLRETVLGIGSSASSSLNCYLRR